MAITLNGTTGITTPAIDNQGNLTVDTNTLVVDSANNKVGVGTASPSEKLTVNGSIDLPTINTWIKGGGHNVLQVDATRTYFYGGTDGVQFRTADNASALVSVDNTGRVTMPYQPAAAASYSGSNLAATSFVPLNGGIIYRGGLSVSGNTFTVPVAGIYMVGQHNLSAATGTVIQIRINGNLTTGGTTQDKTGAVNTNFSHATLASLAANDYIQFVVAGGTIHGNAEYSRFYIFLLG